VIRDIECLRNSLGAPLAGAWIREDASDRKVVLGHPRALAARLDGMSVATDR
jgi:hypothetical protein